MKHGIIPISMADVQGVVPMCSILVPFLFKTLFFNKQSSLYNYEDGNTLSFYSTYFDKVISTLEDE